jgi:hypothetical protein
MTCKTSNSTQNYLLKIILLIDLWRYFTLGIYMVPVLLVWIPIKLFIWLQEISTKFSCPSVSSSHQTSRQSLSSSWIKRKIWVWNSQHATLNNVISHHSLFIASNHQTVQHKTEGLMQTVNTYKIMYLKKSHKFHSEII